MSKIAEYICVVLVVFFISQCSWRTSESEDRRKEQETKAYLQAGLEPEYTWAGGQRWKRHQ